MAKWFPLWTLPLIAVLAVGTVWLRLRIVDTTYGIVQTDRQIENVRQDKERLELSVARLRSPGRLEALARTRFKLAPPQPDQVVHLGKRAP